MFGFLQKYSTAIPTNDIVSHGLAHQIGTSGRWHAFLWDAIPHREYSRAPASWFDVTKLDGADFLVSGVARSEDGTRVIKVEFFHHFRKCNTLHREGDIITQLNDAGCVSAPKLLTRGELPLESIISTLPPDFAQTLIKAGITSFQYLTLEYIESSKKSPIEDILVSVLEQKSLGYYHGDVKPANLRYDNARGICILIDYDQARPVPQDVKNLNASDFLRWCDTQDKIAYPSGPGTWRRHFKGLKHDRHIKPLLRNGAFNLATTTPYNRQATTNTKNGVYHTIRHTSVFADGVRDLNDRAELLDQVKFSANETVLDIGCNAGLLVHYLANRGCRPTGIELDSSIVVSAQMVANIIGVNARFFARDLDAVERLDFVDTICLFSVIHHTRNLYENGIKIANACNRILIECRLSEHGKKPKIDSTGKVKWEDTSVWHYQNESELCTGLSKLFPGFSVLRKIGHADKNRMLLEMVKQ